MIVLLISYDFMKNAFNNFDYIELKAPTDKQSKIKLQNQMREIIELFNQGQEYDRFLIMAKLHEILSILNSSLIKHKNISKDYSLAKEVLSYIHQNYNEDISQQESAEVFNMSRENFARVFKQTFGFTFLQYLIDYRLHKAYPDIVLTDKSLIDIAIDHGFPDSRSLIKHFKAKYKMTPGEYRKDSHGKHLERHSIGSDNVIGIETLG